MRYLLDTNIVSELVSRKPNERVVEYINSLSQESIFLSVITIGEINSGIQNVQNEARKQLLLEWLYNDLFTKFERRIIEIDSEIMLVWGDINHQLKKTGNPLPVMDSLIGA
ncbi:MAG: PIN domain-containing protein, partial [Campylobacterales bacterium]